VVSAFATNERLVLGQEACAEKSNETTAIPALLARLAGSRGWRARAAGGLARLAGSRGWRPAAISRGRW